MAMSLNINIHRPRVQDGELGVYRPDSTNKPEHLIIGLGDGQQGYRGSVVLYTDDSGWDAIVAAVDAFRASESISAS